MAQHQAFLLEGIFSQSLSSFLIFLSYLAKNVDIPTRPNVSIIGVTTKPSPQSIPIADTTHINAAVVIPISLSSCCTITPPPKKPIPVTIVESILVGSPVYCAATKDAIVKIQDPTQIYIIVRNPALLFFSSRS